MKPERQFNANEGDYSIGLAGPDAIEEDIDTLARMFDPLTTHSDGSTGGISTENIQENVINDDLIGDRTINDAIPDEYSNTGKLGKLLSFLAKVIKEIKGTSTWYEEPADTIENIDTRVTNHKTSNDHDSRYYTEIEIDNKVSLLATKSDVYSKQEIDPWLAVVGGETNIKEEVFIIVSSNNGDGTFSYSDSGELIVGELGESGEQIFNLVTGTYEPGNNRIEAMINDTLRRSAKSGGLIEINNHQVAITFPEGNGAEITFKYYERIGLTGEHNVIIGENKPLPTKGNTVWFKVIG